MKKGQRLGRGGLGENRGRLRWLGLNRGQLSQWIFRRQDLSERGVLPADCKVTAPTGKKDLFLCRMVPLAVRLNSEVYRQRVELLRLKSKLEQGQSLDGSESEWLQNLRHEYEVSSESPLSELLARVDIVPMGLLLAQAADESSWGQSWPATKGFNFFGMHGLLEDPTCMHVPGNPKVCLIRFASAEKGVAGYIQYMNTAHFDFTVNFRKARAAQRASGKPLDSLALVQNIKGYSEVGASYIVIIRRMLQKSDLEKFDDDDKFIENGAIAVH